MSSFHSPARVQIAPMLAVTDRHFRQFIRGITKHAELWTEMQVDSTVLHTKHLQRWFDFDPNEHPIVCQVGGSDPTKMAKIAELVSQWGYDEMNINVGCPSQKVAGKGCFGAALMKRPDVVRDLVYYIKRQVPNLSVSVKTRSGVDEWDSPQCLNQFITTVSAAGCHRFIIHARKAWLKGLNPAKNRTIPPLQYERVYTLAKNFPHLSISINGGVSSLDEVDDLLYARWRPTELLMPKKYGRKKSRNSHDTIQMITEKTLMGQFGIIDKSSYNVDTNKQKKLHQVEWDSESLPISWGEDVVDITSNCSSGRRKKNEQPIETQCNIAPISQEETSIDGGVYEILNELELRSKNEGPVLEGVMIGRVAMNNPCILASVDSRFYDVPDPITAKTPRSIVTNYINYLDDKCSEPRPGRSCFPLMKPILGLLTGRPGCKQYRHKLDEVIRLESCDIYPSDVIRRVLSMIDENYPGTLDTPTTASVQHI